MGILLVSGLSSRGVRADNLIANGKISPPITVAAAYGKQLRFLSLTTGG
jgi:hypothetical protein